MTKAALAMASLFVLTPGLQAQSQPATPDPWAKVRFLEGTWVGSRADKEGKGTITRQFKFILSGRFLQEKSTYAFPPQPQYPDGFVTVHASILAYEDGKHLLYYRQSHEEHRTGSFVFADAASTPTRLVFELKGKGPAVTREVWEVTSPDSFVETLEAAPDGKAFTPQSRIEFKRKKG